MCDARRGRRTHPVGRAGAQGWYEAAPAVATTLSPSALLSSPARTHAFTVDRTRATSAPLFRNGAPAQISSSSVAPPDFAGLATPESRPRGPRWR
ncbi:hypothetical protein GCM10017668_07030 [Streptomyces tuirus]|uniref:Uncharacterized protein n=1 Tax=Streptomyces tuirus TaxID=68278 RepID=A0A7G1NAX0_9ACTN|nr:hypothetical protein GCM10017668_07030 [Streptomyces tuirus]